MGAKRKKVLTGEQVWLTLPARMKGKREPDSFKVMLKKKDEEEAAFPR